MRRRDFIRGIVGSAGAWPLVARAQQSERMRRIGVLLPASADDARFQTFVGAFLQELQSLGWSIGRNVRIDTRWATANTAAIRRQAAELAALAPDVILAHGAMTVGPLLEATRTVPIVFPVVADPVGAGFVESLARPGGNATGFMNMEYGMGGKWLEVLRQFAPSVTRVAVIRDTTIPSGIALFGVIQAMAQALKVEVTSVNVRDADEIDRVLAAFARAPGGGLIVTGSGGAYVRLVPKADIERSHSITSLALARSDGGTVRPNHDADAPQCPLMTQSGHWRADFAVMHHAHPTR